MRLQVTMNFHARSFSVSIMKFETHYFGFYACENLGHHSPNTNKHYPRVLKVNPSLSIPKVILNAI